MHLRRRQSVSSQRSDLFKDSKLLWNLSQNWLYAVVHRIQIWWVRRPFCRKNEVLKMASRQALIRFHLVSRVWVGTNSHSWIAARSTDVLRFQTVVSVHLWIDIYPLVHRNELSLATGINSVANRFHDCRLVRWRTISHAWRGCGPSQMVRVDEEVGCIFQTLHDCYR